MSASSGINGVAGSGKSSEIATKVKPGDLVIAATRGAVERLISLIGRTDIEVCSVERANLI